MTGRIIRVLDLYCGGGGVATGIIQALGDRCQVTGVDFKTKGKKYYPGKYIIANVLSLPEDFFNDFDFIWASPPCQCFSRQTKIRGNPEDHPDLIDVTRKMLVKSGLPYCIENVVGDHDKLNEQYINYMIKRHGLQPGEIVPFDEWLEQTDNVNFGIIPPTEDNLERIKESLKIQRACFDCGEDLSFNDYLVRNYKTHDLGTLFWFWNEPGFEIVCCGCFNIREHEKENERHYTEEWW